LIDESLREPTRLSCHPSDRIPFIHSHASFLIIEANSA
jgi:hypothetical protein